MKKLSIKETLIYCKDQYLSNDKKLIIIIPETMSTKRILQTKFESFPGLARMNYNGWIQDKKDIKALFYDYYDNEIAACWAIASKLNKSLICMGEFSWDYSDIPTSAELIICYNERALTIGKLLAELRKKENPENVIPVFCAGEEITFVQERTNGGLFTCEEFKSVLLESSWFGPAVSLASYIDYLSSNFPDDTAVECWIGYPVEVISTFETNVLPIQCVSSRDINWLRDI